MRWLDIINDSTPKYVESRNFCLRGQNQGEHTLGSQVQRLRGVGTTSHSSQQWLYPKLTPDKHDKKGMLAVCLAVAVKECFMSHMYSFAGEIFRQLLGGGIGLRLTGVVAKMRMTRWTRAH